MNDIKDTAAEITTVDAEIRTKAQRLAGTIRELLAVCAATVRRSGISPVLVQDADGNQERAAWSGIKFAGGRKQSHMGQSGTWVWSIYGSSYYVALDGTVYSIDWDGTATDFDCKGYMDDYTSEIEVATLEEHLDANPDSAEEIVTALRKAGDSDLRARKTIRTEIAAVIARLVEAA